MASAIKNADQNKMNRQGSFERTNERLNFVRGANGFETHSLCSHWLKFVLNAFWQLLQVQLFSPQLFPFFAILALLKFEILKPCTIKFLQ